MANLLTYRGGRYERKAPAPVRPVSPRLSQAGNLARASQQLGQTVMGIGAKSAAKATKERARMEAKAKARRAASESAEYQVKQIQFFETWARTVDDEEITDDMVPRFDEFAKKHQEEMFDHFTDADAKADAKNNWAVNFQTKKSQFALDGIKRDIDNRDAEGLRNIEQFSTWATPAKTLAEVVERGDVATQAIEDLKTAGSPSFQSDADNEQMIEDVVKAGALPWLMNEAMVDPTIFEEANALIEAAYDGSPPDGATFDIDDINNMKAEHNRSVKAAEATANQERTRQANTFYASAVDNLLAGTLSMPDPADPESVPTNILDQTIANTAMTGPQKHALAGYYNSVVASLSRPKPYSEAEKLQAFIETSTATNEEDFMQKLTKNIGALGATLGRKMYTDWHDPAVPKNTTFISGMNKTLSDMHSFQVAYIKQSDDYPGPTEKSDAIGKVGLKFMRLESEILMGLQQNPLWTETQKRDFVESKVAPVREEVGGDIVTWFDRWIADRDMGELRFTPAAGWLQYGYTRERHARPPAKTAGKEGVPSGLEASWGAMNEEERSDAMQLISQGVSIDRIKEALR